MRRVQIKDIAKIHYGKALKKDDRVESGDVNVFGSNGIVGSHNESLYDNRTVIIGRKGSVGKTLYTEQKSWTIDTAFYSELNENQVDPKYFYYALTAKDLEQYAITTSIPGINRKDIYSLKIPLPSLDEQKAIVVKLDRAQRLIDIDREMLTKYDELIQSVFLDMFGDPADNPKEWEEKKLGEIINFKGGSQPAKKYFQYKKNSDNIRLVQIRDFKTDKYLTYIPRDKAKRFFSEDDVMIARYGPPVFQILRGLSGSYNVALMKAEPKYKQVKKSFVFHLLQSRRLHSTVVENSGRTAGQSGVNLKLLNNYPAYLPPLQIQENFEDVEARIVESRKKVEAGLKKSKKLFSSLLNSSFPKN